MKRSFYFFILLAALPYVLRAQSDSLVFYGELNNVVSYTSRSFLNNANGYDLQIPSDISFNQVRLDMNDRSSTNYSIGHSILGLRFQTNPSENISISSCIEADFVRRLSESNAIRFRKAYINALFPFGTVLAGIDWHPFAADAPMTGSFDHEAPFNAFNFSPQLLLSFGLSNSTSLEFGALWQHDFRSLGPDGYSTSYIENSTIPELYAGLNIQTQGFHFKLGADFLRIKPRTTGLYPFSDVSIWVNDIVDNLSFFTYADVSFGDFTLQAKSILAQSGEHLGLLGGYVVSGMDEYGSMSYTPYTTSTSWLCLSCGKFSMVKPALMAGYIRNLGAGAVFSGPVSSGFIYPADSYNFLEAFMVSPSVRFNYGHLHLGIEYKFISAVYGDKTQMDYSNGLAGGSRNTVFSHSPIVSMSFDFQTVPFK